MCSCKTKFSELTWDRFITISWKNSSFDRTFFWEESTRAKRCRKKDWFMSILSAFLMFFSAFVIYKNNIKWYIFITTCTTQEDVKSPAQISRGGRALPVKTTVVFLYLFGLKSGFWCLAFKVKSGRFRGTFYGTEPKYNIKGDYVLFKPTKQDPLRGSPSLSYGIPLQAVLKFDANPRHLLPRFPPDSSLFECTNGLLLAIYFPYRWRQSHSESTVQYLTQPCRAQTQTSGWPLGHLTHYLLGPVRLPDRNESTTYIKALYENI